MAQKTVLVTGAMGCIGAWVLKHLVAQGQQVVAFDLSTDRHRLDWVMTPDEQAAITFVQGDLTDTEQVKESFKAHEVTHVVHLAALQVPFCRANPVLGAQVNVTGTVNVFEATREAGIRHLAYASSIAVYGPASDYPARPVMHNASRAPRTLYGVYKVANEGTAQIYWQDHKISSIGLRPYTVYGVGRDQGLTSDPTKAMWAAVKGESFEIAFGGVMQFQLASDVALQFIDAVEQNSEGAHVFNLGTPPVSVDEVIELIRDVKPDAQITRNETRLPFPESFDDSALRAHVSRVYETPLAEGIRLTMEHFETLG
jgi:nucleoside-diphosphate-sugar epimerase